MTYDVFSGTLNLTQQQLLAEVTEVLLVIQILRDRDATEMTEFLS